MTGKRVCLTYEEKLWIINHQAETKEIKQTKIAVDFQAKFKSPFTRQCKILQMIGNDPELNVTKMKHFKKIMNTIFEADLVRLIDEKYKRMNVSHEIIRLCAQKFKNDRSYRRSNLRIRKFKV